MTIRRVFVSLNHWPRRFYLVSIVAAFVAVLELVLIQDDAKVL